MAVKEFAVRFLPGNTVIRVAEGTTLLRAQILAGLSPDAPCGGKGTCGKCRVTLDGRKVNACQTPVDRDMTVELPRDRDEKILIAGKGKTVTPDGEDAFVAAFDVGTTTVAAWLLEGKTGRELARAGRKNPQAQFGADVISRIQAALKEGGEALADPIRETMEEMFREMCTRSGVDPNQVATVSIVGNTAMHHLLLGIDPQSLVKPPYMPKVRQALELEGIRVLPNIAGFVGADTVGCLVAQDFGKLEELSLLLDIGTNGEMVLGNKERRIACSAAAGPAFEGAGISCGMGARAGAVDRVWLENGEIRFHVIGDVEPEGLCGSGLLDLVAALLEQGEIDKGGKLKEKQWNLTNSVYLTRKDVRQVQLAKGAIRAGIELLAREMDVPVAAIQRVYLAGGFGNYLDPDSACRIGMIPVELRQRIESVGNAAGAGAKLCALSRKTFLKSETLARGTEFLELGGVADFQREFLFRLDFPVK